MKPDDMNLIQTSKGLFINGKWESGDGAPFQSENPATGEVCWRGHFAFDNQIKDAFNAAKLAHKKWQQFSLDKRIDHIKRFGKIVKEQYKQLAELISIETGKPLWEANTEVSAVIAKIDISIKAHASRRSTQSLSQNSTIYYKSHGVVCILGPFNFPAHLSNGHMIPALIAGNTIVYKPSELTPMVAEFIIGCWEQAGIPQGVINLIQGGAEQAISLCHYPIKALFFTGSYETGVKINQLFAKRPEVLLALEMGGNNPLVIDSYHDLEAAVYQSIQSSFITAGQRCTAARRLIIKNDKQGDQFLDEFIRVSKYINIGAYKDDPEPFMGPVISHKHAQNHLRAQEKLLAIGGKPILKMKSLYENTGFLSPGIIEMSEACEFTDSEIFAPLVQVYRYNTLNEACKMANQTSFGLSASLFATEKSCFNQFFENINAGIINWNKPTTGASSDMPFGGIGQSGNHRPCAYFSADYCDYPIASLQAPLIDMPKEPLIRLTHQKQGHSI